MSERKIKATQLIADIRSRASDFELMEKYSLSLPLLERVLEMLVERCALRQAELAERGTYFDDPNNRVQTRRGRREYLRIPLIIEQVGGSSASGIITDLSERGFRARGLEVSVFEKKWFEIRPRKERTIKEVQVEAVCRWTGVNLSKAGSYEAGFEIVKVSERDSRLIREMMIRFGVGDRNVMRPKSSG